MQQLSNIKMQQLLLYIYRTQKTYSLVTITAIFLIQLFYMAEWAKSYDLLKPFVDKYQLEHPFYYQLIGCIILAIAYLILLYCIFKTKINKDEKEAKFQLGIIFILLLIGQIITFVGFRGSFLYFIARFSGISTIVNNILIFIITLPILYIGQFNFQENDQSKMYKIKNIISSFQEQQFTQLFGAFLIQLMQTLSSTQTKLDNLSENKENDGFYLLIAGYIILIVCNYLEYKFIKKIAILTKIMMAVGILICFIRMGNGIDLIEEQDRYIYILEGFISLFIYPIAFFSSTLKNKTEINSITKSQINHDKQSVNTIVPRVTNLEIQ